MLQHSQATKRFPGRLPQIPSPPVVPGGRRRSAAMVPRQSMSGVAYTQTMARLAPSQFVHVESSMPVNNSHVNNGQDDAISESHDVILEMFSYIQHIAGQTQEMITDLTREVNGLRLVVNDIQRELLEVQMVLRFTDVADPAVVNPTAVYHQPII